LSGRRKVHSFAFAAARGREGLRRIKAGGGAAQEEEEEKNVGEQ